MLNKNLERVGDNLVMAAENRDVSCAVILINDEWIRTRAKFKTRTDAIVAIIELMEELDIDIDDIEEFNEEQNRLN